MKFSNYQACLNSRLLGLLPYKHNGHNSSLGISWWHETSLFEQYILQLQWPTNVTAKTKFLTAKTKTSRQKQKPHGKTKDLTAKANTHGKTKAVFCCSEVFDFAVGYFFLPWGFWFCREVFCFCREVFGFAVRYFAFAVRFLVLPWCFRFCREVFGFAVTVVGHHR